MEPMVTPGEAESQCPVWHLAQTPRLLPCFHLIALAVAAPADGLVAGSRLSAGPGSPPAGQPPSLQRSSGRRCPAHGLLDQRAPGTPSKRRAVIVSPRGTMRIITAEWPGCLSLWAGSVSLARLVLTAPCGKGAICPRLKRRPSSLVKGLVQSHTAPRGWHRSSVAPSPSVLPLCPTLESLRRDWAQAPPAPSPQAAHQGLLCSPRSVCRRAPCPSGSS